MIRQVRVGLLLTIATTTLALLLPCIAQAGPIGYWSLDGTLADSSGNDQHGTVGGTAGSFAEIYANDAPAQLGQRQSFEFNDATAIYLPFLDTYHKSHTTGTTVSMWIKAERQGDARLFGEGYTGSDRPFYAIETLTDGKLRWYIRAWTNPPGTATQLLADTTAGVHLEASNPQWHHLLWTDEHVGGDQHDLKVYVDGVHDKTFTYNWQDSSLDRTTLGGIHAGNIRSMIEGRMADVAVWDRVLGAAYIEDLAKGTRGPLPSTLFAEESFDYAAGPLGGNDGGLGWSGAWSGAAQAVEVPGLEYTDSQGNQLVTAGNAGKATSTTASYRVLDLRPDSAADVAGVIDPVSGKIGAAGTSVWLGLLGQWEEGTGWAGISLFDGSTEKIFLGKSTNDDRWRLSAKDDGSINYTFGLDMTDGETALLVARLDFVDGVNDTVTAWLNPDMNSMPDDLDGLSHTWTTDLQFDRLRLAGSAQVLFDEIRLGTRFSDVVPVPEPGSLLLLFAGLVGLLGLRQRQ